MNGWDYSRHGIYFITICVHQKSCLFGSVIKGKMKLNAPGEMVRDAWANMPRFNPGLVQDVFVVMPNHFHAIVGLIDSSITDANISSAHASGSNISAAIPTVSTKKKPAHLSNIVRKFKTFTMNQYKQGVNQLGWIPYNKHLWQRSYADHIIEAERDLQNHREYVFYNPLKWHLDRMNPRFK